jgi:hypothetical protein
MARNEAPAAAMRGLHGKALGGASIGAAETTDLCFIQPDQLRCCESPFRTKASGHRRCWLHCNIQVVCHNDSFDKSTLFQYLIGKI